MKFNINKFFAFTLAEVLITLLIISVVAGLTVPNIINDVQDKEFQTAYKKKYAEFSQGFARMRTDNGGTIAGVFHSGDFAGFQSTLKQYFNITGFSSTSTTSVNANWLNNCYYKTLNNQTGNKICSGCPSATFVDGSFFYIYLNWGTNDLVNCNFNGTAAREGLCFNILLDINGRKFPNIMGKDIYILAVYKDKTVPADWIHSGAITEASCDTSSSGDGCAIKYLK